MKTTNFVQLCGTEKQIAWAEDIRNNFFGTDSFAPTNEKAEQIITHIINLKTDAKWWIEEVNNKAMIDRMQVLRKCADCETMEELQKYMVARMK